MRQGILTQFEYNDITRRTGYSPTMCFSAVVNEILTKASKRNVVKKFTQALKDEKDHAGHKDLLKIIESKLSGMYHCMSCAYILCECVGDLQNNYAVKLPIILSSNSLLCLTYVIISGVISEIQQITLVFLCNCKAFTCNCKVQDTLIE